MTWTKLPDDYADQLEALELSAEACWLNTAALIYCNRMLTDGRMAKSQLRKVTSLDHLDLYVAELEQQGVWEPIEGDDAWLLDWTHQDTAEDVRIRVAGRAARQKRYRQRLERCRAGDHSLCDAARCKAKRDETRDETGNVTHNATRSVGHNETPSRPVPSRPEGVGTGTEGASHLYPQAADRRRW
jgi:hypothetical protein